MPHVAMAMDAREHIPVTRDGKHLVHDGLMTVQASVLSHAPVARLDLDRLVEIFEGKGQGVKEAIVRLGHPLSDEIVWQMAVVAPRHMVVTGILPGVVMLLHDVAVDTGLRIVAQVAGALTVAEGEDSDTAENPQHDGQRNRERSAPSQQAMQ